MTDALMPNDDVSEYYIDREPCAWCGEIVDERQIINGHCYLCRMTERPQPGKAEGEDMAHRSQAVYDALYERGWAPSGGDAKLGFFHAILDGLTAKLDQDGERIPPVEPGRGGETRP